MLKGYSQFYMSVYENVPELILMLLFNTFTAKRFSETRPFMHLSKHIFRSQ